MTRMRWLMGMVGWWLCVAGAASAAPGDALQVQIEVRFVTVKDSFLDEIGVDFRGLDEGMNVGTLSPDQQRGMHPALRPMLGETAGNMPFQVGRSREVQVLSSPKLLTTDGERATIFAGGDVPYQDNTYQDVGFQLQVIPTVIPDNRVRLDVTPQVTEFDLSNTLPTLQRRRASTQVVLPSGGSVVIGGIYDERAREAGSRIPALGDLPILGALFRNQGQTVNRNSLFVLISPVLLDEDGRPVGTGGGGHRPGGVPTHTPPRPDTHQGGHPSPPKGPPSGYKW